MAEETSINIGGTYKDIDNCEVNIGGTYKQVTDIWANIGGTFKKVWTNLAVTLAGLTSAAPITSIILTGGDLAETSLRLNTDGTLETAAGDDSGPLSYSQAGSDFLNTADGALCEVLITAVSETGEAGTMAGATIGSYIAISTARTWTWQKDTNSVGNATKTVDITVRVILDTSKTATLSNLEFISGTSA